MKRSSTISRRVIWLLCAAALAAMAGLFACDYTAKFYPTTYQLDKMEFVSVLPAVKDGDLFKPECTGKADSLIFRLNFIGMGMTGEEISDADMSLRPGDVLKTYGSDSKKRFILSSPEVVNESNFSVTIKCMEPLPDPDLGKGDQCQGAQDLLSSVEPNGLWYESFFPKSLTGYYPRTFGTKNLLGVAILIDQSGSIKGWVDKATAQEATPKKITDKTNFDQYGSDLLNHRLAAVTTFLNSLNPTEKSIVFRYGEILGATGDAAVVCYNPDAKKEQDLRADCYGTKRNLVTGSDDGKIPSQLKDLETKMDGRTPLWASVMDVYDFMFKVKDTEVRHVLVIGDGPDTCHEGSPDYNPLMGDSPCAKVGYDDFRSRVIADLADTGKKQVHVSFVQFQSKGYPQRDPRQQEMACMTGGHYVFVNSEDLADEATQAHQIALEDAMMKIRYALTGSWSLGLELGGITQSSKLRRGAEVAIEGDIILNKSDLTDQSKSTFLRIGMGDTEVEGLNVLDLRGSMRLPCSSGTADCSWFAPATCQEAGKVSCLETDGMCAGEIKKDLEKCVAAGTKEEVCCHGHCVPQATVVEKSCIPK